jgi:hypothetical protein
MILKSWSTDGIEDTTVGCYLAMILSILAVGNIIGMSNLVWSRKAADRTIKPFMGRGKHCWVRCDVNGILRLCNFSVREIAPLQFEGDNQSLTSIPKWRT